VDHPMYYADSLDTAPQRTTLLCADKTHAAYALRFYSKIDRAIFFPTGGEIAQAPEFTWQNRPMDVLFIGSYKEHTDVISDEADVFLTQYLQNHTDEPFESALEAFANKVSTTSASDDTLKALVEAHRFSETNLTARYRKDILKQLAENHITVHVYGSGWEKTGLSKYPNFVLHAPVSFRDGLALMSQAKIVLNHMAWFKHGSSERIFNAMSQGALCLTDSSAFLENILTDDKNCALYSLDESKTGSIAERIKKLLSSEESWQKIARSGYETSQEHTWHSHMSRYLY